MKNYDFRSRWTEEVSKRGISQNQGFSDPTDLASALNTSLSPGYQCELGKSSDFGVAGVIGAYNTNVDMIRTDYLVPVSVKEFIEQVNSLRSGSQVYSKMLKNKYLIMLDSMSCHKLSFRQYEEGKAAISEAIKAAEGMGAIPQLKPEVALFAAAHIQAKRQAFEQKVYGSGREPEIRSNIRRFAKVPEGSNLGDCNVKVQALNYEDIVANMFICDGDVSRNGRGALSNKEITKIGLGVYQRTKRSALFCCVVLGNDKISANKGEILKELLQDSGSAGL